MEQYNQILSFMKLDSWYKAKDFLSVVNVKERRIKVLLNELLDKDLIVSDGKTKGKQ